MTSFLITSLHTFDYSLWVFHASLFKNSKTFVDYKLLAEAESSKTYVAVRGQRAELRFTCLIESMYHCFAQVL